MQYYYVCGECNNPVPEAEASIIQPKIHEPNTKLVFCGNCMKSVNAEFLKKKLVKPNNTNKKKKKNKSPFSPNAKPSSHLYIKKK